MIDEVTKKASNAGKVLGLCSGAGVGIWQSIELNNNILIPALLSKMNVHAAKFIACLAGTGISATAAVTGAGVGCMMCYILGYTCEGCPATTSEERNKLIFKQPGVN